MPYFVAIVADFAGSHYLRGYDGACQRLHGHNWKVEVEVKANSLDDIGIAVDFKVVKACAREIISRLDHYNLNEISPFDTINPTAENIAKHFYDEIKNMLADGDHEISAVTIWETERAYARYEET